MKNPSHDKNKHITLEWITWRASIWALLATTVIIAVFILVACVQEIRSNAQKEERRITMIAAPIARSIASEMLVGDDSTVALTIDELTRQFNLTRLRTTTDELICNHSKSWYQKLFPPLSVCNVFPLSELNRSLYLQLESETPLPTWKSSLSMLLWISFPLILFGFFTTYRIRKALEKAVVKPIKSLAQNPEKWEAKDPAVAQEAITLHEKLKSYIHERNLERDRARLYELEASMGDLAAQVAHDIRSPLTALDMLANSIDELPEEKRVLLRGACSRIRDIANGLLNQQHIHSHIFQVGRPAAAPTLNSNNAEEPISRELLSVLIESIVSEKRIQYRKQMTVYIDSTMTQNSYGLFARVQPTQLKRVLSNLIDNSVEALVGGRGKVAIELESQNNDVVIRVRDNGRGIPADILPKLMQKGMSFNKENGSGFGLYHAKKTIDSWGGKITLQSEPKRHTTIEITLPKVPVPQWFVPEIQLTHTSRLVILDDDPSIHHIWQGRFDSLLAKEKDVSILHFSSETQFVEWHRKESSSESHTIYLVDYELLGDEHNGLDIIEQLGIQEEAILVTSRFQEPAIRTNLDRLCVGVIPKQLAGLVPVTIVADRPLPVLRTYAPLAMPNASAPPEIH